MVGSVRAVFECMQLSRPTRVSYGIVFGCLSDENNFGRILTILKVKITIVETGHLEAQITSFKIDDFYPKNGWHI